MVITPLPLIVTENIQMVTFSSQKRNRQIFYAIRRLRKVGLTSPTVFLVQTSIDLGALLGKTNKKVVLKWFLKCSY